MEEFANWIMDELEKLFGEDYWMKYMEMEKGNGKIYHGILIVKKAKILDLWYTLTTIWRNIRKEVLQSRRLLRLFGKWSDNTRLR